MSSAVVVTCLLALQQLQVVPTSAEVGDEVVVTASREAGPAGEVAVTVELPDGARRPVGVTDAEGRLTFVPEGPGQHAFAVTLDGVRHVAPVQVAPRRARWWLGWVSVPLGLALLFAHLRRTKSGAADR